MYMFRSRRNNLTRKLLRARKRQADSNQNETWSENEVRVGLLKRLKDVQLEFLLAAVESEGADVSACVLLPRTAAPAGQAYLGAFVDEPHVLCCRLWRWPDLLTSRELKRLPVCASAHDPVYICCNPYHLSRMATVELNDGPPPYERFEFERLKPEDRAPSELPYVCGNRTGSLSTSGEGGPWGGSSAGEWCRLAYWELGRRVGRQFGVEAGSVHVFSEAPGPRIACGLSLATLVHDHMHTNRLSLDSVPDSVLKTRTKIKHGVILSREPDGIWAYNLSKSPIFVNSPSLGQSLYPLDTSMIVSRVSPGECILVYRPHLFIPGHSGQPGIGPTDPLSVRISFAKGWGRGYSRTEIIACPCWLEVLLAPCR